MTRFIKKENKQNLNVESSKGTLTEDHSNTNRSVSKETTYIKLE